MYALKLKVIATLILSNLLLHRDLDPIDRIRSIQSRKKYRVLKKNALKRWA